MPYCPRCGVEVTTDARSCPLCATPVPQFDDLPAAEPAWPRPGTPGDPARRFLSPREIRGKALGAVTGVLVTSALVTATVDLALHQALTWSWWPLGALAAVWALTATALGWHRKPARWVGSWYLIVLVLLAFYDLVDPSPRGWFLGLALPLTSTVFGVGTLTVLAARACRGAYAALAVVCVGLAAGLGLLDLTVTLWLTGAPGAGWSLVTGLVFVPLALLFGFLHGALGRRPDFGRIFHI